VDHDDNGGNAPQFLAHKTRTATSPATLSLHFRAQKHTILLLFIVPYSKGGGAIFAARPNNTFPPSAFYFLSCIVWRWNLTSELDLPLGDRLCGIGRGRL
jgi:hypothetical protein